MHKRYNEHELIRGIYDTHDKHRSDNLVFTTLTLSPKIYKYQPITQYELTVNDIEKYLRSYTCKTTYSVELTQDGNVHYHTISYFNDKLQKLLFINSIKKNKTLGFLKITSNPIITPEQLNRAAQYLIKELNITAKIICRNGYKPELLKEV